MFTALALVRMLILPLNNFPWVINGLLEAKVSLDRIQRFLDLPNHNPQAYYSPGNGKLGGRTWQGEEGTVAPGLLYRDAAKRSQRQQNPGRAGGHFLRETPQSEAEAALALVVD